MKPWPHLTGALLIVVIAAVAARGQTAEEKPAPQFAQGIVFHDANANRVFDDGDKPLAGIRVSNGRQIVTTDAGGRYKLPVDDDTILFVLKPRGWRTPVSRTQLPQFYYIHRPGGSPKAEFPGIAPTGPLPASVDFPLYPQAEPDRFDVIVFGDPQTRTQKEIDYLAHDLVERLLGTKAAFGISLGDILFDDLSLYDAQARAVGVIGIPWYNVLGNHDSNYDARRDADSNDTFEQAMGPSYYSFDYGPVHFVVLDDVEWVIDAKTGERNYRGALGEEQIEFLRNDLAGVPKDRLVVLTMHIPLVRLADREAVHRLIENRPACLSFSGHTHSHEHVFVTEKQGWRGAKPHHHIIHGTACGCWWHGRPDEHGIPLSTIADGVPNGYSIVTFDGSDYAFSYRAAGHAADYQIRIHLPDAVAASDASKTQALATVFDSSERSTVKMRVDQGEWIAMSQTWTEDPAVREAHELDRQIPDKPWTDLPRPYRSSPHVYGANLPVGLEAGIHVLQVETTDMHGRTFTANRIFRLTAGREGKEAK